MQIRTKLTLNYFGLVALLFFLSFILLYSILRQTRVDEFYSRLESKARTTGHLLLNTNQIDSFRLRLIDKSQKDTLSSRFIKIYNLQKRIIYTNKDTVHFKDVDDYWDRILSKKKIKFMYGNYSMLGMQFNGLTQDVVIITGAIDVSSVNKNKFLFDLLVVLYFISLGIVGTTGYFFAKKALHPLSKIIHQIDDLPLSSLNARLHAANTSDEIGLLIKTFNVLLDKIQKVSDLQRLFLSAASHEMKNPLTKITSQLQVIQFKKRSFEEYQQTINSVLEDLSQLNKTSNNLIEFARISYELNLGTTMELLRIDEIIWHCIDYYSKVNPSGRIRLDFDNAPKHEHELLLHANEEMLKTCFINLIDNACKFSPDHTVDMRMSVYESLIEISFSDNGIGISPADLETIFEPFFRSDKTSGISGNGLGLAIVQRIVEIHQAAIEVNSKLDEGSVFILKFPRKF